MYLTCTYTSFKELVQSEVYLDFILDTTLVKAGILPCNQEGAKICILFPFLLDILEFLSKCLSVTC